MYRDIRTTLSFISNFFINTAYSHTSSKYFMFFQNVLSYFSIFSECIIVFYFIQWNAHILFENSELFLFFLSHGL